MERTTLGAHLKAAREARGWTQQRAARELGVSQAYLSLLERGLRTPAPALASVVAAKYELNPTLLPLPADPEPKGKEDLAADLSALRYPGFSHVAKGRRKNPAAVLFKALLQDHLDSRLAAALPWVVTHYPELNWDWLVDAAKLHDLQNRLGFVVTLSKDLALRRNDSAVAALLGRVEARLERSRLVREDVFGRSHLTNAERNWLKANRPAAAVHWNVLSNLSVEHVAS